MTDKEREELDKLNAEIEILQHKMDRRARRVSHLRAIIKARASSPAELGRRPRQPEVVIRIPYGACYVQPITASGSGRATGSSASSSSSVISDLSSTASGITVSSEYSWLKGDVYRIGDVTVDPAGKHGYIIDHHGDGHAFGLFRLPEDQRRLHQFKSDWRKVTPDKKRLSKSSKTFS